ncbi:GTP cyclohydrolase I FolE2 [Thermosipho ferrireducens]|uniref:GTP cyclohydrolase FolE2 n=1 Tax=Thermosipho ferrireducens TaxID=2571116 RepID=A0ABX7S8D6_9BACT|nr:GTP cyclohydrolase FolE2 [Thermosipho ferrireducens]QTA38857.1 GTP cyclohydrolase I FolE2 [Thermosipho ferrireducens]
MRDVQNEPDSRNINLKHVGIKKLRYPITVLDKKNGKQHTIGTINMFVDLPKHFRGTHMSRFLEVLNKYHLKLEPKIVEKILEDLKSSLNAERAKLEIEFPYFLKKAAPVTKIESYMEYVCKFTGIAEKSNCNFFISVEIPIQTLCPCSKEISEYNAHNQRAKIKIEIESSELIWFEDLIEIGESSASVPLFTLLKRPDEKYITETAYNNPKFVEDVARDIALKLSSDERIKWFRIEVESYESIHAHNAYACVDSKYLEGEHYE